MVNQQNAGLGTMETDQILDLFNISAAGAQDVAPPPPAPESLAAAGAGAGISENDAVDATGAVRTTRRTFLDEIGELWDESQYQEEYNLDSFLANMKA